MSSFRVGKVDNYLHRLNQRKEYLETQLQDPSLETAISFTSGRISELDFIIREMASEFNTEVPTRDPQPAKKQQTINLLLSDKEFSIATRLAAWRDKKGGHSGWDGWFTRTFGTEFARKYNVQTALVNPPTYEKEDCPQTDDIPEYEFQIIDLILSLNSLYVVNEDSVTEAIKNDDDLLQSIKKAKERLSDRGKLALSLSGDLPLIDEAEKI
jgi:hypothetical protein